MGFGPLMRRLPALLLTDVQLILLSVAIKKALVGRDWGVNHATPFWSCGTSHTFSRRTAFRLVPGPLSFCAGTILANPILRWMGCRIGADDRDRAHAVLRLERGEIR